jgi:hypothetical protein
MGERSMASHSVRCSTAPFEGNSGCRSTSAPTTIHSSGSCSTSGPTSTAIARISHGKGERRIRPCHGQSPISTRFNGNLIVGLSIRHRWLPDFSEIRARCGVRSTSAKTSNEMIRCLCSQLHRASRLRSFHCRRINSPETRWGCRTGYVRSVRQGKERHAISQRSGRACWFGLRASV